MPSIQLTQPPVGSTIWGNNVNTNWQTIQDILNSLVGQSSLINGGFDFFQRQNPTSLTAVANNVYGPDRWVSLTDGGATDIQWQRVAGDTTSQYSSTYAGEAKQTNASAKKIGMIQWLENKDTVAKRGRTVQFQVRARYSGSAAPTLRLAIIEWTGTADTLGSNRDPVNAWANSADANPNTTFLKPGNQTSTNGYIAGTALTTGFATFTVTATIGTSVTNLGLMAWTSGGAAQNVTIDFTQAGLYDGNETRDWLPRPIQQELAMCQSYCTVFENTIGGANGSIGAGSAPSALGTYVQFFVSLPVSMRVIPTLTANATDLFCGDGATNFSANQSSVTLLSSSSSLTCLCFQLAYNPAPPLVQFRFYGVGFWVANKKFILDSEL